MRFNTHKYTMEIFWHSLLFGCVMTATVYGLNDVVQERVSPNTEEYRDDTVTAEDHEHHRIIIVVPKEIPHHVNHVHTYKLAGKGIPLIHSGKVVHDHKHSGKVAHEHGHKGKSSHTHKHVGKQGHQHKHLGYLGHHHYGKFIVTGGHHKHHHLQQAPIEHHRHHPLLHTAAHKLHLQHQQHLHHKQQLKQSGDYLVQQHGGGSSGIYNQGQHGGPTSGRIQFIPSSKPQGLGSFIPAEIQQYIDGRHGVRGLQQQQQYEAADDGDDDHEGQVGPPAAYNVIHLRVPGDQGGPNIYKQVDIDLANNVAKLQPGDKQQPGVTANFKTVTQYNKVIGHGRAPITPEDEFEAQTDDEDVDGGGGERLLENVGYRFGEGYRLAMESGGSRDFTAAQEQDEEEVDEFKEPSVTAEDDFSSDGNAYSQAYRVQF